MAMAMGGGGFFLTIVSNILWISESEYGSVLIP